MDIVLDKSYLQGASTKDFQNLSKHNRIFMSEILFMELMTTKKSEMYNCFKKLPETENPVVLIPNIGNLIRFEVKNKRPCIPLFDRRIKIKFEFNKKLRDGSFQFTKEQLKTIDKWQENINEDIKYFKNIGALIDYWFPELNDFTPGSKYDLITSAMNLIAGNYDKVVEMYDKIRPNYFPTKNEIDERWALFRWVQVHLIYGIEYVRKYGAGNYNVFSSKIENDQYDINYCISGILSGALATNDKTMDKFFLLILPKGTLFTL